MNEIAAVNAGSRQLSVLLLGVLGIIPMAMGQSINLINRTHADVTNIQLFFKNDAGTHEIRKIDRLPFSSKERVPVDLQRIPPGDDGEFILSFELAGQVHRREFGYGPAAADMNVLFGREFTVFGKDPKGVQANPSRQGDVVLVTWID